MLKTLLNFFRKDISKTDESSGPTVEEMKFQEKIKEEKRKSFVKEYGICLNPDTPALKEIRSSCWKIEKRFSWANIITPEGYVYLLKVRDENTYITSLFEELEMHLGIIRGNFKIYSPEAGGLSEEQYTAAQNLTMYNPKVHCTK